MTPQLPKTRAMPYVILLGFLFGVNLVLSRFILGQISSFTFVSLRLAIAALGYVALFAFSKNLHWSRDRRVWLRASIYGVIGTAIPMNAFMVALYYLSSGVEALYITLSPAVTALLAFFFLDDEWLNWQKISGILIAFIGAGLLLVKGETGLANLTQADWRGYAWTAIGVILASASNVYARKKLRNEDNLDVSSIYMLSSAIVCIPITLFTTGYNLSGLQTSGLAVFIFIGIVGTFFTFLLSFFIVKNFGATANSANSYVSPVITTIFGSLLLSELVTPVMIIGMVIIFIGLALINYIPKKAAKGIVSL